MISYRAQRIDVITYKDRYINAETVAFMFCNEYNK